MMRGVIQGFVALPMFLLPVTGWSDEPEWPKSLYLQGVKVSASRQELDKNIPAEDLHKVTVGRCDILLGVTADGYVRVAQVIKSSGSRHLDHACLLGVKGVKFTSAEDPTGLMDHWAIYPVVWEFTVGNQWINTPDRPPPSATLALQQSLPVKASDYPKGALERKEHGDSWVHVVVSDAGQVLDVKIAESSGSPDLDKAALDAIRAAHFNPAFRNHKPLNSNADVVVSWVLPPDSNSAGP